MNSLKKREKLKEIILSLHRNENVEEARNEFKQHFGSISADEIADLEQNLIESGALTAEQVTNLCDLHVEVFKESIDIPDRPDLVPGHPLHTYRKENAHARELIKTLVNSQNNSELEILTELKDIELHFTRLENQLFPKLEEKGFTGPSQVMWTKPDEIRKLLKEDLLKNKHQILNAIEDMIVKEEKILFPTSLEKLTDLDWVQVKNGEEEIGYAWIQPGNQWKPITPSTIHSQIARKSEEENDLIPLDTGKLDRNLLNLVLKKLPIDISVIDENDEVLYYSDVPDRIFPRSPGVIGRNVMNCHPPKSHHIVKKLLDAFKAGEKDVAEFWIPLGNQFVHIRYFALRDKTGKYLGTLEVTQDITDIKQLEGSRRLLNWDAEN